MGSRLGIQDRAMLFGLVAGLFVGLIVGRKVAGSFTAVVIAAVVVGIAYALLRVTRGARAVGRMPAEEAEAP